MHENKQNCEKKPSLGQAARKDPHRFSAEYSIRANNHLWPRMESPAT